MGRTRIGDLLDAFAGYNESENERFKSKAELLRISTSMLWNINVPPENKLAASELWPFPWDTKKEIRHEILSEEEKLKREKAQEEFLNNMFPNG